MAKDHTYHATVRTSIMFKLIKKKKKTTQFSRPCNKFHINLIVFVYAPGQDSVLQVEKDSYDTCNTTKYIQRFDDGNTVFTCNRSGAFYFISGNEANCMKNESLVVVVLAERTNQTSSPPSPSPVSSLSPPPSPASSSPPSPPPSSSTEVTPSAAPIGEETTTPPPPNGASFKVVGFMGLVGAFLGWVLFVF